MQFQWFQKRLRFEECYKLGIVLTEIAIDKFGQLELMTVQYMSRRRILGFLQSRSTQMTFLKKHHQFFQVHTHVQCLCEQCNVSYAESRWPWQQQNQALYVYCIMRSGLERETPGFDISGTSKTRKTIRKFSLGFTSKEMWDEANGVQVESLENRVLTYERTYFSGKRLETRHTSNSWVSRRFQSHLSRIWTMLCRVVINSMFPPAAVPRHLTCYTLVVTLPVADGLLLELLKCYDPWEHIQLSTGWLSYSQ